MLKDTSPREIPVVEQKLQQHSTINIRFLQSNLCTIGAERRWFQWKQNRKGRLSRKQQWPSGMARRSTWSSSALQGKEKRPWTTRFWSWSAQILFVNRHRKAQFQISWKKQRKSTWPKGTLVVETGKMLVAAGHYCWDCGWCRWATRLPAWRVTW